MLCRSDSDRQCATRPVRHRSRYDGGAHRAHSASESDAVSWGPRQACQSRISNWNCHDAGSVVRSRNMGQCQRNDRPAEHIWRLLFNAAVWLTLTIGVQCSNAANTHNSLKLAGVPQTTGPMSAAEVHHIVGTSGDILLLNKFFFRLSISALFAKIYSQTKLCDGAQMATFWRSFGSCISSEPRATHFRPAF